MSSTTLLFIASIFLIIAGISKALMEVLNEQDIWIKSKIEKFYVKGKQSWTDRYLLPRVQSCWYKYKSDGITPRFFGSTTFLVFLTDGWHMAQFILYSSLFISIPLVVLSFSGVWIIIGVISAKVLFLSTFELVYKSLIEDRSR